MKNRSLKELYNLIMSEKATASDILEFGVRLATLAIDSDEVLKTLRSKRAAE